MVRHRSALWRQANMDTKSNSISIKTNVKVGFSFWTIYVSSSNIPNTRLITATRPQNEVSRIPEPFHSFHFQTHHKMSLFWSCHPFQHVWIILCLRSGHSHETQARSPPPKPQWNIEAKCKLQQEPDYLHVSTKHTPGCATTQRRLPLCFT